MPRADRPDIEIGASVKAKRLRFGEKPDAEVRWAGDSESVSERTNLPEEVEPGVTYRDVEVRWYGQARVAVEELEDEVKETRGRKGP